MGKMKPYSAKKEAEKELQAQKERRGKIFLLAFVGAGMMVTIWMMFALSVLFAGTDVAVDRATIITGNEESKTQEKSKAA